MTFPRAIALFEIGPLPRPQGAFPQPVIVDRAPRRKYSGGASTRIVVTLCPRP